MNAKLAQRKEQAVWKKGGSMGAVRHNAREQLLRMPQHLFINQ
jgi:hypothetical protein